MPTIYVSRNGQSTQLKLRDSEGHNPGNDNLTTDVDPSDSVVWMLDTDSGLESLQGVFRVSETDPSYDPHAVQVLVSDPIASGDTYIGTVVATSPGKGKFENYKIAFTIPGDSTTYYDDPKLQMNA